MKSILTIGLFVRKFDQQRIIKLHTKQASNDNVSKSTLELTLDFLKESFGWEDENWLIFHKLDLPGKNQISQGKLVAIHHLGQVRRP